MGHPDALLWDAYFPVTCPWPSQPGTGHLEGQREMFSGKTCDSLLSCCLLIQRQSSSASFILQHPWNHPNWVSAAGFLVYTPENFNTNISEYHLTVPFYIFCFQLNKDTITLFKAVPGTALSHYWNAESASTPALIRCNEAVTYSVWATSQNRWWLQLAPPGFSSTLWACDWKNIGFLQYFKWI